MNVWFKILNLNYEPFIYKLLKRFLKLYSVYNLFRVLRETNHATLLYKLFYLFKWFLISKIVFGHRAWTTVYNIQYTFHIINIQFF